MTHTEIRSVPSRVELRTVSGVHTLTGYAIRFNESSADLGGFVERIAPGAWDPVQATHDVIATFNHDTNNVLGRKSAGTLRLFADSRGIRYEIDIPETTTGRDVTELVRRGDIVGSSFTFRVNPGGMEFTAESDTGSGLPVRVITSMTVLEVGPVLLPAYPTTSVGARSRSQPSSASDVHSRTASGVRTGASFLPIDMRAIPYNSEWLVTEPAALWVDMIAPRSKFLANLPAANRLSMHKPSMTLPAISTQDASYVAADQPIPEPATEIMGRTSAAVKFGAAERVTSEVAQDSGPDLNAGINQSLALAVARGVDRALFNGAGPAVGDDPRRIIGLLSQAVTTNAAVNLSEISEAIGRMEDTGAAPSVMWCDPIAARALRSQILATEWPKGVYGLIPVVSHHLPPDTLVLADNARIFVGLHTDISVAVSLRSPGAFEQDYALYRAIARTAGVWLQESESVQVISSTLPDNVPDLTVFADRTTESLNSPAALAAAQARHIVETEERRKEKEAERGRA
ncbi:HK97 family phage prohead protease [Streptomyces specialis]|uniref:HK97 family phage prohead protease n=1 Tax=Streptomyces specialis TaxID=498367 RepID=UPI000ACF22B4|nr:HK97 family phage prohead protease [Streptomyces specialis]